RRVRANAATVNSARLDDAVAARDADALPALFADTAEFVEHPTGAVYDREGVLRSLRSLVGARDPAHQHEPLATLGDALALCRVSWSASGLASGRFDIGAYEMERFHVIEVDAQGRRRWGGGFAVGHLGHAIVRLYERYAELLPDGPARARAAATARSVAVMMTRPGERRQLPLAPAIEQADHRILGTWSARGTEEFLRHWRSLL